MKQHLRPIMFVGTCSDAGKSVINAAFCRIFKQDGYQPAPFKAQNMSLNSYSTPEGGEMGRAQVVQAEACGISPHTDMNPILLKPTNDKSVAIQYLSPDVAIIAGGVAATHRMVEVSRTVTGRDLFQQTTTA